MMIQVAPLALAWLAALPIPVSRHAQKEHAWIGGNVVAAVPATRTFTQTLSFPYRFENFTGSLAYPIESQASFDVGGGIVLRRHFGIGVSASRMSTSRPASVAVSVPDVLRFNMSASAAGVTTASLAHTETATHLELTYVQNRRAGGVRLFIGPSMIRTTQEVITAVQYDETNVAGGRRITLMGESYGRVTDTAFGVNLGADGCIYFDRHVGVGAGLRFSRALATIKNVPQSAATGAEATQDLSVGGLTFGAGVRVRF